jgi:hypothetical protein
MKTFNYFFIALGIVAFFGGAIENKTPMMFCGFVICFMVFFFKNYEIVWNGKPLRLFK